MATTSSTFQVMKPERVLHPRAERDDLPDRCCQDRLVVRIEVSSLAEGTSVHLLAIPSAVDPPTGERADAGAATTRPASGNYEGWRPRGGLLGFAWGDGRRDGLPIPEARALVLHRVGVVRPR